MGEHQTALQIVDRAISDGTRRGVAMLTAEDEQLDGRTVQLAGEPKVNFASCSYLGLELDPRVVQGAVEGARRFGTQFSSSRTYISAPPYAELESLLDELTGGHCLVTPNTTLGHLSTLPILVDEGDAVILDHQVHHTVQLAVPQLRAQGAHVEFLRHGRVDRLEERVRALRSSHARIWYLVDGIYSMYGNAAPIQTLEWLAGRYEQLHLYIDDAHGMSWCGLHGRGHALGQLRRRERTVVAVSLNKAFAAGGGAIVFPDAELCRKVRTCAGPMIFTGPVQPPLLAAAIASARIHLSPEIVTLQEDLRERIRFANRRARELELPLVSRSEVPIRFIGMGLPRVAINMSEHLMRKGFLVNAAVFPAVPAKRSGIRCTITRHQSQEDIGAMLEAVAKHLPRALEEEGGSLEEIERSFRMRPSSRRAPAVRGRASSEAALRCEHVTSIHDLDREEWDRCLGARGSFGWEGLAHLERVFGSDPTLENHWKFHYYVVRETSGRPVLASFFTEALWKDDLVAPAAVSRRVEERRAGDPHFLTSRVFAMGSLLTEGDHLYLDREADWRSALALLLARVEQDSDAAEVERVVLRDLPADDEELDAAFCDAGFTGIDLPPSMLLPVDWEDWERHLEALSYRARRFQRRSVQPHEGSFEVEILGSGGRQPDAEEWQQLYRLYRNVQERSFDLNTYPLPEPFFPALLEHPCWELLILRPRAGVGTAPRAFVAAYRGPEQYAPVVPGLDYEAVESHGAYRQLIREVIRRAESLGSRRVLFGMGAELEKERFGARRQQRRLYVLSRDHFQHDVLALLAADPDAGARED